MFLLRSVRRQHLIALRHVRRDEIVKAEANPTSAHRAPQVQTTAPNGAARDMDVAACGAAATAAAANVGRGGPWRHMPRPMSK